MNFLVVVETKRGLYVRKYVCKKSQLYGNQSKRFSMNQLRIKTLQWWELGWDSGRHDLGMLGLESCVQIG